MPDSEDAEYVANLLGLSPSERESLRELNDRAANALQGLRASQRRPLIVEFSGTPKSGKTTCIENVRQFFQRNEYKVATPAEGASRRTPAFLRQDLVAFNAWSAMYAVTQIIERTTEADRFDIAFLDRGLFDSLCWFEKLKCDDEMTSDDCQAFANFVLHWKDKENALFFFTTDVDTALRREFGDKWNLEGGQAMRKDVLQSLNNAYSTIWTARKDEFQNPHRIETPPDGPEARQTAFTVIKAILGIVEETR